MSPKQSLEAKSINFVLVKRFRQCRLLFSTWKSLDVSCFIENALKLQIINWITTKILSKSRRHWLQSYTTNFDTSKLNCPNVSWHTLHDERYMRWDARYLAILYIYISWAARLVFKMLSMSQFTGNFSMSSWGCSNKKDCLFSRIGIG